MKNEEEYELTERDKQYILENIDKQDLISMTRMITGDEKADGRHKVGKKIKIFAIEKGLNIKTSKYVKKEPYKLSTEEQAFIEENIGKMQWMEMSKQLFNEAIMSPRDMRAQAVYYYVKEVAPSAIKEEEELVENDVYEAPKTLFHLACLVNRYVQNPHDET